MATKIELMELSDPLCVPDTFVEGIGVITRVGGCIRYTLWATRDNEKIVVARIVWPAEDAAQANKAARAYFENGVLLN